MPLEDLFTSANVFIKPIDKPEADWQELVGDIVRDSITITESASNPYSPATLNFTATLRISRKNRIRLLKSVGLMKRPRCTYKTIKRKCAKRNRK